MTKPNEIYFYENLDELIGQVSATSDCEATTAISSLINLARNENNPKANRLLEEAHLKHQVTYGEEFNLEDLARPAEVNQKISAPNLEYLARTKILAR